jgi:glyoxylase-like metal-dependent hydrolase (beta-lactamase superfamily II)
VQIVPLEKNHRVYSCRSYLILGSWNRIEDLNTVIDPGSDDFVLDQIERLPTGLGKVAVEQIILTHNHSDHAGAVAALKQKYGARVLAFEDGPGVDELIGDGQFIRAGDDVLEVIHTPGHSHDSICLYAPQAQAVFSGDTQLRIRESGDDYCQGFLDGLARLCSRGLKYIYSGHDDPVSGDVAGILLDSLAKVQKQRDKRDQHGV